MPWLALLALLPLGAILTVAVDHLSGNAERRRDRLREGSSVITPARELVNGLGPEALISGTNEQAGEFLDGCYRRWWDELREPLMIFLNQQSARVRKTGDEFATSVGVAYSATRFHLLMRATATDMSDYEAAVEAKEKSLALADDLLRELRRRWWWLRLPAARLPRLRRQPTDAV